MTDKPTDTAPLSEDTHTPSAEDIRAELEQLRALRDELNSLRGALAAEQRRRTAADEINSRNADTSAGGIGQSGAPEHYTPAEVRAMSRDEVHRNYNRIVESMKYWN